MDHARHKAVVDKQKALADTAGKRVAASVLRVLNFRALLTNPPAMKKAALRAALTASDKFWTENSRLGWDFGMSKVKRA